MRTNARHIAGFAVALLALAASAGAESPRATVTLPAIGCKNPEDYTEAARLTHARSSDPGSGAMLRDWLDRHGCVAFREGETVTVRKSGHFDSRLAPFDKETLLQLQRAPDARERVRGMPPPVYWTAPEAIGR